MPESLHQPTWRIRELLPGGLASLLIHAVLIFAATSALRGCQKGMTGETGGEVFRRVGIVQSEEDGTEEQAGADGESEADNAAPPVEPVTNDNPDQQLPGEAPSLDAFAPEPNTAATPNDATGDVDLPPLIGSGAPLSGLPNPSGGGLIQPAAAGGMRDGGGSELQPGETAFLGVADSGASFVYVIDTSSSMGEQNRLQVAKNQLKASLRLLQPNQQFQVIFYNEAPTRIRLRAQKELPLYYATAANVLKAEREVGQEIPNRGTKHMPALLDALSLSPEVIYFLTDGREPQLFPNDLEQLRRVNSGTTIHVIEFTDGTLTSRSSSWLEKLARQSGGEYRGFNVRGIGRPAE